MLDETRERRRRELVALEARVNAARDRRELRYRGSENPGNPHAPAKRLAKRGVLMKLEPRRSWTLKGRRSRRLRKNQWVVA